ncbi:MAG: signal peptide peptidase SppA [Opitutales bacterium]
MKSFFSSFFASLLALVVFCGGGFLLIVLLVAAISASKGEQHVAVQKGSYLVFDLSGNIQDKPEQMEGLAELTEAFGGSGPHIFQLRSVTRALQAAAKDPDIAGLYLCGQMSPLGYGSGFGALKEVREALLDFKSSGKPIKAYLNFANTRDYYLASAASEVILDPYGVILMPGLGSRPMFFTGLFEKLGIGVQVTRVGKYKSAVEPFIRKDMSPENRQQTQKLLDDVWAGIVTDIEQTRKLAPGSLQQAVDSEGLLRPEAAQKFKLIDRSAYYDVVLDELKAATGRKGEKQAFKQIDLKDYAKLVSGDGLVARRHDVSHIDFGGSKGKVAIVYAEGEIVDGNGNESDYVWGGKVSRLLRELRQDDSVKAIVLRVNSPGGSASASEEIQRELRLTRPLKPVIVSMGTVAASGGYWISTASDRIFAEPGTITGSIGVFGMFLNIQGLATDKLGLTFDTVKTGKFADAMSATRPKTEEELAMFQRMVDWIYDEFIGKVAEARKLDRARVQEIAQGRVWSGTEAKTLGLVDEIGGLNAALKYAGQKAGLGDSFRVVEYPRKKQFAEVISEAMEGKRHDFAMRTGPLSGLVNEAAAQWSALEHLNDPQGLYARLPFELGLK